MTLIVLTGLAAFLVPKILDQSQEQGYREIEGQGKPPITRSLSSEVSTRFPVRPFREGQASDETEPKRPERQAFPGAADPSPQPSTSDPDSEGLPQREVLVSREADESVSGEVVTTRAWVARDSSVFLEAKTTASVLGSVGSGTQVRWVRQVEPGWEEILLKDGRRVYMLTSSLRFKSEDSPTSAQEEDSDVSLLPGTVDDLLATLRDGDLLRAETYLAPNAPGFEGPASGPWTEFIGADARGRVGRIESVDSGRGSARSVLITDDKENGSRTDLQTVWRWDGRQGRWLLSEW